MSTVPTSRPLGVYTGTRFFPVSTRSYAIKRLLRRSFHRARLSRRDGLPIAARSLRAIGALNGVICTTPLSRLVKRRRAKARHAANHACTARDWRCVMAPLDRM